MRGFFFDGFRLGVAQRVARLMTSNVAAYPFLSVAETADTENFEHFAGPWKLAGRPSTPNRMREVGYKVCLERTHPARRNHAIRKLSCAVRCLNQGINSACGRIHSIIWPPFGPPDAFGEIAEDAL